MPIKIVQAITKLEFGGAQQVPLYTLEHLPEKWRGFLVCGKGGLLDKKARSSKKFITRFCPFLQRKVNPVLDLFALVWMIFYYMGLRPDIVHTHSSKAGIISRWAAKIAGVPVIIHTFHGFGFSPLQKKPVRNFFVFLEKVTANTADRLIAVAKANIEKALNFKIGKKEQYLVIRAGIDIEKFEKNIKYANIKKEFGLSKEQKLVGNISCFKPQKGLLDYVEVCSRLAKRDNCCFILVGDGRLRRDIQKKVEEKGIKEKFFMPGWRRDIENIIPGLDLMVHTSYFEGLPRVFLEAMAGEVPIVATNVDGAVDVIEHGVNGYLANAGNIDKITHYADKLLSNDKLSRDFARKGKVKLNTEFDIKIMSDKLNSLYKEMLKERKTL